MEEGMKAYREAVVSMFRIIDYHFPTENAEVQKAKDYLLQSLGQLRFVQLEHEKPYNSLPFNVQTLMASAQ